MKNSLACLDSLVLQNALRCTKSFLRRTGTWDLAIVDGLAHQLYVRVADTTCSTTPWCRIELAYRDHQWGSTSCAHCNDGG